MTAAAPRSRYQGVLQILRFNWPMYAAAVGVLVVGAATLLVLPLPQLFRAGALIGVGLAAFWLVISLTVSHYIYDRAGIYRGDWLQRALPAAPRRFANLHAGLDEFSDILAAHFPGGEMRVLDFFDAQRMTEPSIGRARGLAQNQPPAEHVDFRALPLRDEELDAAFLIFAAHELREHEARVALFAELRRSLKADGKIVVVEHLRDAANLFAFGPGFLHFHSRGAWLRAIAAAQLRAVAELSLTPFVCVLVLEKQSAQG